jgi:sec-independent protein translocase protein TatC
MAVAVGRIGHEEHVSVLGHLEELRAVPVGVLAATRTGVVSTEQLRHNRRYAIAACGAVAALRPGDAITLILETVPLYVLFELSVLLARISGRREARRATAGEAGGGET